ncbi:unnamed protein product [Trifolium pratense]|uniref:Uncharacterized protein n=1 Tax=Trifolium pratense TaxID=57577 RepID=A0ACB0K0Q4_TRIPR|nr:unnamed protein product [Trifolium pratense]
MVKLNIGVVKKLPYISRLVPFVSLRTAGPRYAHAQPSSVPRLHIESFLFYSSAINCTEQLCITTSSSHN